jgi:AcrR family transcriptional regulator
MPDTAVRQRRTQEQRRAETRSRFLRAAVLCLVERGYAGTTTVQIQQAAGGLSRGALQHYWPCKAALVVDAVDSLFDDMCTEVRRSADRLRSARGTRGDRIEGALQLLWNSFNTPLFRVSLELWLAARVDDELKRILVPHESRLVQIVHELCRDLFGEELAEHPRFRPLMDALLNSMRGAALTAWLQPQDHPYDELLAEWSRLARQTLLSDPAMA